MRNQVIYFLLCETAEQLFLWALIYLSVLDIWVQRIKITIIFQTMHTNINLDEKKNYKK